MSQPFFNATPDMLDTGVFISYAGVASNGAMSNPVNPQYCATMAGAEAYRDYLASLSPPISVQIVMDGPLWHIPAGGQLGFFAQSKAVPWLVDGKGAKENAGQLITNYLTLPYALADKTSVGAFALDDQAAGQ